MKFFKYLIFTFIFLSSTANAVETWTASASGGKTFSSSTANGACLGLFQTLYPNGNSGWKYDGPNSSNTLCAMSGSMSGTSFGTLSKNTNLCPSMVSTASISAPGWQNMTPDQTVAYLSSVPKNVCHQGCTYSSPSLGSGASNDSLKIDYGNPIDNQCTGSLPSIPRPPSIPDPSDTQCKSGEAYCDKPTTGCPSGYTSGTFNGKQICVKNNPDPTKPNPNDPNNNSNNSKFDDSKIIAAINASKDAITSSINNSVNSINSSISSINQSITTVANAVTGTTNAVNNNTNAVNAVKSSVDALHNTINAVTTAVNNNTSAVTSAVNANTNAVKASVDALNSTVSAVTSAVDNNTKAVNANGDKVANAVKDNITATNAVKTAVDNLNSAVNAVTTAVNANGDKVSNSVSANGDKVANAVNANGDKVTDAVNKGTEATKENGKKLDGVKSSVDEGNGLLKDIKDWLTKEPELETGELEIKEETLPGYERKDYVQFTNTCPFSSEQVSLPMGVLGSITFTKDLTFICSYASDARPYIIGLGYLGALIYLLYGLRSRNG
ncbi:MAG: hypothetical protein L0G61_00615 [Staphylococcus equorum]|nr:hypothetical protein [Staphylococcus equorum]